MDQQDLDTQTRTRYSKRLGSMLSKRSGGFHLHIQPLRMIMILLGFMKVPRKSLFIVCLLLNDVSTPVWSLASNMIWVEIDNVKYNVKYLRP